MNHAITLGGLLLAIGMAIGLTMVAVGLLATFASGMSDNPEAGASAGRTGCAALIFGALIFCACLWGLLS